MPSTSPGDLRYTALGLTGTSTRSDLEAVFGPADKVTTWARVSEGAVHVEGKLGRFFNPFGWGREQGVVLYWSNAVAKLKGSRSRSTDIIANVSSDGQLHWMLVNYGAQNSFSELWAREDIGVLGALNQPIACTEIADAQIGEAFPTLGQPSQTGEGWIRTYMGPVYEWTGRRPSRT